MHVSCITFSGCKWLFNETLEQSNEKKNNISLRCVCSDVMKHQFQPLLENETKQRLNIRMVFPELNILVLFMKFVLFAWNSHCGSRITWYVIAFITRNNYERVFFEINKMNFHDALESNWNYVLRFLDTLCSLLCKRKSFLSLN